MDYPKFIPKTVLFKNTLIRYGDTKLTDNNRTYYIYYVRKDLLTKDLIQFTKVLYRLGIFNIKSIDLYYQIFSISYINNSDFYGLLDKLNCIISVDDFSNLVERW